MGAALAPRGLCEACADPCSARGNEGRCRHDGAPAPAVLPLDEAAMGAVPAREGVYRLFGPEGAVLVIKGVANLRSALTQELGAGRVGSFAFEEAARYTARESQLLQQHIARHGSLPGLEELG